MPDRKLTVWGERDFTITVPEDAKVTFGPFSPPGAGGYRASGGSPVGTLRIYKGTKSTENVIAVFSGVSGFRDDALDYEEGATPGVRKLPSLVEKFLWEDMEPSEKEELAKLVAEVLIERNLDEDEEKEEDEPEPLPF